MEAEAQGTSRRARILEEGEIIVARSNQEIERTVARWREAGVKVVAHDLECASSATVPNGTGLHPHLGVIRLAQFGVVDGGKGHPEALVIDCWRHRANPAFELLADPEVTTLVHYAQMEVRWLAYCHGLRIANLKDTWRISKALHNHSIDEQFQAEVAKLPTFELNGSQILTAEAQERYEELEEWAKMAKKVSHSLGVVVPRHLDYELDKTCQNSHWDAVKLTTDQLEYAGRDVLSLHDLWERFEPLWNELPEDIRDEIDMKLDGLQTRSLQIPEQGPANCESARAMRMIRAARSKTEIDNIEKALPFMRIHYSRRDAVHNSLRRWRRKLERGDKPRQPVKVQVANWDKPF